MVYGRRTALSLLKSETSWYQSQININYSLTDSVNEGQAYLKKSQMLELIYLVQFLWHRSENLGMTFVKMSLKLY